MKRFYFSDKHRRGRDRESIFFRYLCSFVGYYLVYYSLIYLQYEVPLSISCYILPSVTVLCFFIQLVTPRAVPFVLLLRSLYLRLPLPSTTATRISRRVRIHVQHRQSLVWQVVAWADTLLTTKHSQLPGTVVTGVVGGRAAATSRAHAEFE